MISTGTPSWDAACSPGAPPGPADTASVLSASSLRWRDLVARSADHSVEPWTSAGLGAFADMDLPFTQQPGEVADDRMTTCPPLFDEPLIREMAPADPGEPETGRESVLWHFVSPCLGGP